MSVEHQYDFQHKETAMKNRVCGLGMLAVVALVASVSLVSLAWLSPRASARILETALTKGKHHKAKHMPYKDGRPFIVTIEADDNGSFSTGAYATHAKHYDAANNPLLEWTILSSKLIDKNTRMTVLMTAVDKRKMRLFDDATGSIVIQTSDGTSTGDPGIYVEPVDVDPCAGCAPSPLKSMPAAPR